jgi:hypothetical protein
MAEEELPAEKNVSGSMRVIVRTGNKPQQFKGE